MPFFDEKRYKNGSETEVKSEPFVIRLSEDYVFHDTCLKHLQYELVGIPEQGRPVIPA